MNKWASIPLRIGLGIMFAAHGAQKVFGVWGGPGMENFTKFVTSLGFPFPEAAAAFAAYTELIGGLCLLIGLGTRISSVLLFLVIVAAGGSAHLKNGFFLMNGGVEYTFIIAAACLSLAILGTGKCGINDKL